MSERLVNRRSTIFLPFRIPARWVSSASAYPKLNRERLVTLLTRQNTSFVYVGRPVSSQTDTKTDGWHRLFVPREKKLSPVSSSFIILGARGVAVQLPFFSLEVYFFRVCGRNLQGCS